MQQKILNAQSREKNHQGFALLEILVSMVVLTFSLLGMAGMATSVMQGNMVSSQVTTATTLAQEKLEDITRLGYALTPATDSTTSETYNTIANFPLYKRVTATKVDLPGAGMKTVTVTVFWNSDTQSVVLPVILSR